jgi:formate/nitrite transporter
MEPDPRFDALLPTQVAAKAEAIGVSKASMDVISTLLLAMLAGAFISLGAVFSTITLTGSQEIPFGLARAISGLAFSLGLVLVVVAGAELFTGNNLLVMAFASGKISLGRLLRNWTIVYVGNFAGAVITAAGMFAAGVHRLDGGQVGVVMRSLAESKCSLAWDVAFFKGVFCNALVCLALWLCLSCRGTGEKILAIVMPVAAFIAAGFEHSVANMYFVPAGIFVRDWSQGGTLDAHAAEALGWTKFVLSNLVPVTLGNIVGGGGLVATVYWCIHLRGDRRQH